MTDPDVWHERLLDGTHVVTRPVRPSDAAPVAELFSHMDDRSRRRRFFITDHVVGDAEAAAMVDVDQADRQAYVVEAEAGGEVLGIAQLAREGSSRRAEIALAVADAWQGRGIGTLLLERLAQHARSHDVSILDADVLAENTPMIEVLEHSTHATPARLGAGVVRVSAQV